jgi:hypothetical protein
MITNETEEPQDLTVLFIDSGYAISVVYPIGDQFNRFVPYDEKEIQVGSINADSVGIERLVIISNSSFRTTSSTNFSFLAQDNTKRTRGITDNSDFKQLLAQFQQAGFDLPLAEDDMADSDWSDLDYSEMGSVHIFQWETRGK